MQFTKVNSSYIANHKSESFPAPLKKFNKIFHAIPLQPDVDKIIWTDHTIVLHNAHRTHLKQILCKVLKANFWTKKQIPTDCMMYHSAQWTKNVHQNFWKNFHGTRMEIFEKHYAQILLKIAYCACCTYIMLLCWSVYIYWKNSMYVCTLYY